MNDWFFKRSMPFFGRLVKNLSLKKRLLSNDRFAKIKKEPRAAKKNGETNKLA